MPEPDRGFDARRKAALQQAAQKRLAEQREAQRQAAAAQQAAQEQAAQQQRMAEHKAARQQQWDMQQAAQEQAAQRQQWAQQQAAQQRQWEIQQAAQQRQWEQEHWGPGAMAARDSVRTSASLILGIVSIVFLGTFQSLVCGIIGLVLASKERAYNPKARVGWVCSLIGVILFGINVFFVVVGFRVLDAFSSLL